MKRLLKGGRVVDPANGRDGIFDILIDGDRIARVGKDLPADGATVIEVPAGFVVTPGLFDMHVHLREPGQEHKETVAKHDHVWGDGLEVQRGMNERLRPWPGSTSAPRC